jgi:hypothetical protein
MTSRATRRWPASSATPSSARACPIDKRPLATSVANFLRQLEQPEVVGHRRAILPHRGGDSFLGHLEIGAEPLVGRRLVDGIEILALNVLDERHLQNLRVVACSHVLDDHRHAQQPGALRRPPPALAGDDAIAAIHFAHTIG